MGRRSHSQTLNLWANGEYVGRWTVNAAGNSELQYDAGWCASPRGRPISLSLPFNLHNEPLKGARVSHYFDGLLPDSEWRAGCGTRAGSNAAKLRTPDKRCPYNQIDKGVH